MCAMAVADGAHIVLAVFQHPQEYLGKKDAMSGDKKTITDYAAIIIIKCDPVKEKLASHVHNSTERLLWGSILMRLVSPTRLCASCTAVRYRSTLITSSPFFPLSSKPMGHTISLCAYGWTHVCNGCSRWSTHSACCIPASSGVSWQEGCHEW